MQYFEPKHFEFTYLDTYSESIFISFDGRILISNCLHESILGRYSYEGVAASFEKFIIIHSDRLITYEDLTLINTAISVIRYKDTYIILLSDKNLVYITKTDNVNYITKFNEFVKTTCPDFIGKLYKKILIYSGNKLFVVNAGLDYRDQLNIKMYKNVIGYLAKYKILLILYDDLRVEYIETKLYTLNSDNTFNNVPLILIPKLNGELLTCISIVPQCMLIAYDSKINFYVFNNKIYSFMSIQDILDVKYLDSMHSEILIMLSDDTLLIKYSNLKYPIDYIYNVCRYFLFGFHLICIHNNKTVSIIISYHTKDSTQTTISFDTNILQIFFTKTENFDLVNDILKIFYWEVCYESNSVILFYLSMTNTLKCLNVVSLEFISLDNFIMVQENLMSINLIEQSPTNYI